VDAAVELYHAIEDHIAQLLAAASRDAVLPGEPAAGLGGRIWCWAGAEAHTSSHLQSCLH
jgi:hypothetical protein